MVSRKTQCILRISGAVFAALFFVTLPVSAQFDPDVDPNSPTPTLTGFQRSIQRPSPLAMKLREVIARPEVPVLTPNSTVVLQVGNVDLLPEEGANAFRVYALDDRKRQYRFPVLGIHPVAGKSGTYSLTVKLQDEQHFWPQPRPNTGLTIYVSWRGLVSNAIEIGPGKDGSSPGDNTVSLVSKGAATASFFDPGNSPPDYVGPKFSGDRVRFLEQATFGPNQTLDIRLRRMGLKVWLNEQFILPYPTIPYPDLPLKPSTAPADCDGEQTIVPDVPATCFRDTYTMYPVQTWFYKEALYGDAQLRHRVAWALSQIWVISGVDTQQASHMVTYHQQLSKNAFGNYRQLMADVTLNPGMGNYLDMIRSTKNNPNENYPRELMQLFTVGLYLLNQDGTLQLDGSGNPIPTYDQTTVNNVTKVFTGWRDCNVAATCPNFVSGSPDYKDPMLLVSGNHDLTAKTLLNYPGSTTTNIAACSGCTSAQITAYANNSLNQALDNIYNHPNVAPFVSRRLIQHLVTGDPSPAYVGRMAAVFNANRSNPDQLREVVRAILLDPEARGDAKTDPAFGKLREPVQLVTNILRQFNAASADGSTQSDGNINRFISPLGQNAFNSGSVFNYYSPLYVVPGTTLNEPEFGVFNTGTSIGRANLANTFIFGKVNISNPDTPAGTSISFAEIQPFVADTTGNQLVDYLNTKMMHGTMSAQMKTTILNAVTAVPASNTLLRMQTAVYLIATSSQYQVQR